MTGFVKPVAASGLLLLLLAVAACGEESTAGTSPAPGQAASHAADGDASGAAAVAARPAAPAVPNDVVQARRLVAQELPAALTDLALERAWAAVIPRRGLTEGSPLNLPAYRREVLEPLYQERDFRPIFANLAGGLSDRAQVLLNELHAAHQHAMDATPYRVGELDQLEPSLTAATPLSWEWALDPGAVEALAARLQQLAEPSMAALARIAAGLDGESPVAGLAETFEGRVREAREALRDDVDFELIAAHAFLSYAFDMKFFNTNRMSLDELAAAGGQREVQRERLRQAFRDAADATPDEFAGQLEALYPPGEQYPRLMTALARYRQIVDAGGWERVAPRSLSAGHSNPRVADLKRRLQIEGFYEGPIDNEYDDTLVEAVRAYQETHQMEVTGEPHDMFWRSLNTPADRRLAQIELTLQRWRETRLRDESYYVVVNIPDFYAEVWRDGVRESRFRIVVGNTDQECDPETGRMRYVNATPLQSAEIEYLVFNPYWNVPTRIREDELDLELAQDPTWLQENGYEVVVLPSGPRIRQLPGPDNALGEVKFIFPNIHNTYMHDTPNRRYFDFPIRNYSHGCMRVQNPMDFAQLLLSNDGHWDPDRIQRILDSHVETTIHLDTHVPIFIEYYVVRVDEQGRTHFLSDIYRYDRERLEDWEPEECTVPEVDPAVAAASTVIWNEDGTAVTPDGTVIHPDGTVQYAEVNDVAPLPGEDATPPPAQGPRRVLQRQPGSDDDGEGGQPDPGDYGP